MKTLKPDVLKIKNQIVENFKPEKIIIFGSYAWGKPGKDSDLDLFIIKKSKKRRIDRAREVRKIIFGSEIATDILVYTPKEVKERNEIGDPFIERILEEGKIIYTS